MRTAQTVKGRILSYAAAQDIGQRNKQEDRFLIHEFTTADGQPAVLALVADGIGGHSQGEVASQMVSDRLPLHLAEKAPGASDVGQALRTAVEQTGQDIYEASQTDASSEGMGTTCTAIVVVDGRLYLSHVGDSRLYLLRGTDLHQLSIDHTWAEEAVRAGFPPEDIRTHPNRGVLRRHLGIDPGIEVDTRYRLSDSDDSMVEGLLDPMQLEPGDVIMLCSDGMGDVLERGEISRILHAANPGESAGALVKRALESGADDNVTAVVLRMPGSKGIGRQFRALFVGASVLIVCTVLIIVALALRLIG